MAGVGLDAAGLSTYHEAHADFLREDIQRAFQRELRALWLGATLFWVREGGLSSGPGAVMQTPR